MIHNRRRGKGLALLASFAMVIGGGSLIAYADEPATGESNNSASEPVGYYENVDQSLLATVMADSEELQGERSSNSGPVDRILDGNSSTFWHSKWKIGRGGTELPHYFIVKTRSGEPIADVSRVILGTRQSSSGSGRAKNFEVYTRSDGNCTDVNDGWSKLGGKEVEATDRGDQTISFDSQPISCLKVVYLASWDGSNNPTKFSSLAEINLAVFHPGTRPLPSASERPAGTAQPEYPLPADTRNASDVIRPLALDERVANNADRTPIAIQIPNWNGEDRIIGARPSTTSPVADLGSTTGTNYFVDCIDPAPTVNPSGDGSADSPWTTLTQVNAHGEFSPGDKILFKRGTVCPGLLHPLGSGTAEQRITIDAYGNATDPLPRLEGRGINEDPASAQIPTSLLSKGKGIESAVVRLFNQEYWTIRNLEITNYSNDAKDYSHRRRGVVVALEDYGRGNGYEISDLYIHDVLGAPDKDLGGSGGIQFEAYAGSNRTPTSFGDIEVHHNRIEHVSRSGINEGSNFRSRPSVGGSIRDNPFEVWGAMDVHDNILNDLGGDAIVTQFASNTKVYNNTVWDSANHHGGRASAGNNAALWPWDADNVSYFNNHVFETRMPRGTWDGTAFDADYGTTGTLFEYNITHDNEGGFMLFCGCGGLSTQTTMRYNISLNDGRGAENHNQGPRVFFVAGQTDAAVYNNTFLVYPQARVDKGSRNNSAITYQNNVFLAQGPVQSELAGTLASDSGSRVGIANNFRSNIFAGTAQTWPQPENNTLEENLHPASGDGIAVLRDTYANPVRLGNPLAGRLNSPHLGEVPVHLQPTLGAFQTKEFTNDEDRAVLNGGFELGDPATGSPWTLANGAQLNTSDARTGQNALELPTSNATATQEIRAGINYTYRLLAVVKPGADGSLPQLEITNPKGHSVVATPSGDPVDGWQPVTAVIRTAWDATTLTVKATGSGLVDDVTLLPVKDYVVDGSYESLSNSPWTNNRRSVDSVSGGIAMNIENSGSSENREVVVTEPNDTYTLVGWGKSSTNDIRIGFKNASASEQSMVFTGQEYEQKSIDFSPGNNRFTVYCYKSSAGTGHCDDISLVKAWDNKVPPVDDREKNPTPTPEPTEPGNNSETTGNPVVPNPTSPVNPGDMGNDEPVASSNTGRIAGKDRVGTSLEAWRQIANAHSMVIVENDSQADALSATPLAKILGTGVVYTSRDYLPTSVIDTIRTHGVESVTLVGGTRVLSNKLVEQLHNLGITVTRVSGPDRYETALQVAEQVLQRQGNTKLPVVLATGTDFADSLVAGPVASKLGGVVLLSNGDVIPQAVNSWINHHATQLIAVGGPAHRAVKNINFSDALSTTSVFGKDRYHTSALVATKYFEPGSTMAIASGEVSADAVIAGSWVAIKGGGVILTTRSALPDTVKGIINSYKVTIFGGKLRVAEGIAS